MDITQLIESFGFPISVCIACGWFIYKMYLDSTKQSAEREKQNKEREEKNYLMLGKFQVSIDAFSKILEIYEGRLGNIENDVKEIKVIVNK